MTTSSNVLRIKYRDIDIIYGYLFASLWPLKEAGVDSSLFLHLCLPFFLTFLFEKERLIGNVMDTLGEF